MLKLKIVEKLILILPIIFALLIACETEKVIQNESLTDPEMSQANEVKVTVGKIYGKIVDKSTSEPISAVDVNIEGTNIGARTDLEGNFYIIHVPPGKYILKAKKAGYKTVIISNVVVKVKESSKINFKLESVLM